MKILVTGSNGLLGSDLCWYLASTARYNIIPSTRKDMDITKFDRVWSVIKHHEPDIVIHTAAETNVDLCEEKPDYAFLVNTISTQFITVACRRLNIPIVFISTCGLFSGEKDTPYTEYDLPNPITIYGKSKYEAEKIIRAIWGSHFIVRPGWLFGGGINHRKNFVAKRWLELQNNSQTLSAMDKFGSPTYTIDLSKKIIEIIEKGIFGTYHVVNTGRSSRYEWVSKIIEFLRLNVQVKPVDSSYFPRSAPVPRSEALENYNLKLMGLDMRGWEEALQDYIYSRFFKEIQK